MYYWYVVDPTDGTTISIIATSLPIEPPLCLGPAAMVAPNVPVPQQSVTMQVVNGVLTPVVDPVKLQQLVPNLGSGLKLF